MENTEKVVYLDNAATTACAPEALAVMVEALNGACGNPSSHYSVGYEAKEFVPCFIKSYNYKKVPLIKAVLSLIFLKNWSLKSHKNQNGC